MGRTNDTGLLRLIAVILMAAVTISFISVDKTTGPRRLVTLGQSLSSCSSRTISTGSRTIGCSSEVRGIRRGGGVFMKPPK